VNLQIFRKNVTIELLTYVVEFYLVVRNNLFRSM